MKELFVAIMFSLLLLPFVHAESLTLNVYDMTTNELLKNSHVTYFIIDKLSNATTQQSYFTGNTGVINLNLTPSDYNIELKYDDLASEGKDLYYNLDIHLSRDMMANVYMMPVGSLKGTIVDSKEKTIKNAFVRFDCVSEYGVKDAVFTDNLGNFYSYYLPIGDCRVGSAYDEAIGFSDVKIEKGKLITIKIKLNGEVGKESFFVYYLVIFLIIVVIVGYFGIRNITKSQKSPKNTVKKEQQKDISLRTKDILGTLKVGEKEVVNYLLENNNESTMAKIYYKLGIPKTSLARIFDSLEFKNIAKTERIGKLRKIELTPWFLGNGEKEQK